MVHRMSERVLLRTGFRKSFSAATREGISKIPTNSTLLESPKTYPSTSYPSTIIIVHHLRRRRHLRLHHIRPSVLRLPARRIYTVSLLMLLLLLLLLRYETPILLLVLLLPHAISLHISVIDMLRNNMTTVSVHHVRTAVAI